MPAPFAALEQRTNAAGFRHVSNASGTLAGAPVSGVYDAPYATGVDGGIAGAHPQFALSTGSVPPSWEGEALHITEGQGIGHYTVLSHEPDGTGWSVLILQVSA